MDRVELALDEHVAQMGRRGRDPQGFQARTLAAYLERILGEDWSPTRMASLLQDYRKHQSRLLEDFEPSTRGRAPQVPRYVIASEGYGRVARWHILAKPSSDPKTVREARRRHAEWVVTDTVQRWASDVAKEIAPSLQGTEVDEAIADAVADVTGYLNVARESIERRLTKAPTKLKVSA